MTTCEASNTIHQYVLLILIVFNGPNSKHEIHHYRNYVKSIEACFQYELHYYRSMLAKI
jgi:hypothetical protein